MTHFRRLTRGLILVCYYVSAAIVLPYSLFVFTIERGSFTRIPVALGIATLCGVAIFLYRAAAVGFLRRWSLVRIVGLIVLFLMLGVGLIAVISAVGLSYLCEGWARFRIWRGQQRPTANLWAGAAGSAALVLFVFPWLNAMYFSGTGAGYQNFDYSRRNIFYEINEDGFRGPRVPVGRTENKPRLLFMGDSSTFGFPYRYSEAFPHLITTRLAELGLPDVEILNAGTVGQSISQIRHEFDSIIHFEPDVVFMMVGMHFRKTQQDWENIQRREPQRLTGFRPVFGVPILAELAAYSIPTSPLFNGRIDGSDYRPTAELADDPDFQRDFESFGRHLEAILDEAQRAEIPVVLIEYMTPVANREIQREASRIARRFDALFVPLHETLGSRIETAQGDGIHPDREGHRQIATEIGSVAFDLLKNDGAGPMGR